MSHPNLPRKERELHNHHFDSTIWNDLEFRDDDIVIATYAKSGTTWMQQILHQLKTGGDDQFESIYDVVPWLEFPREDKTWQQVLADYENLSDPRIFKTHCTREQTPGSDCVRIILTSRDPRDCCVSFYHHIMDMTDQSPPGSNPKASGFLLCGRAASPFATSRERR